MEQHYAYAPVSGVFLGIFKPIPNDILPNHTTPIPPLPAREHYHSCWSPIDNAWHYEEVPLQPGAVVHPLDQIVTYADCRRLAYPDVRDYMDGLVKGDADQMSAYIQACLDVKQKWPKDMPNITMRQFYMS